MLANSEVCLCGHSWWEHEHSLSNKDPVRICDGDMGLCECEQFMWAGEEEEA